MSKEEGIHRLFARITEYFFVEMTLENIYPKFSFTDNENETKGGKVTYPRSYSWIVRETGM